jgi:hypothetical protein
MKKYYRIDSEEIKSQIQESLKLLDTYHDECGARLTSVQSLLGCDGFYGHDGGPLTGATFRGDPPTGWRHLKGDVWVPATRTPDGKAAAELLKSVYPGCPERKSLSEILGVTPRPKFTSEGGSLYMAKLCARLEDGHGDCVVSVDDSLDWTPPDGVVEVELVSKWVEVE